MKRKLLAVALIASSGIALAEEPAAKPWYQEARLFDGRSSMEASGISPFLYFDSIYAANVHGGIKTSDNFTAQTYAGVDLNLEKLLGWNGTTVKVSMVDRQGHGIAGDVGGIYDPMTINGGANGQVVWLYQFWIEKTFGKDWAFKFGRTSMDEDFADNELNRYSLSTSINGPIRSMMLDNAQIYSFPLGLWGGRVKYTPSKEHQFQLGAYQINDSIWNDYVKGTDWSFRRSDGVTFMGQYDWTPRVLGRPARLYVGVADSAYDYTKFNGGNVHNILRPYGHFDFQPVENLTLFTFAAYTPQDNVAEVPLQVSGGANWKGLLPGRENDHTMAFVTYAGMSDKYGQSIGQDTDYEMVYEVGHRIQIIPSFYIQPSVQYIQNPGGTGNIDNAVVLGAWIGASF